MSNILEANLYIIAEINTSHFGDLDQVENAISLAERCGANAIKFQSWKAESLYTKDWLAKNRIQARFLKKFSLSQSELRHAKKICDEFGLGFSSTPYTVDEIAELEEMGPAFLKIASMDLVSGDLLEEAVKTGLPLVVSTGMATEDEINEALSVLGPALERTVMMHCVSLYPTDESDSNVLRIKGLRDANTLGKVGFSDHSRSSVASTVAVGLGATVFEKHLTLDSGAAGFDNAMALEGAEFERYVNDLKAARETLGTGEINPSVREYEQRAIMRRSAHYRDGYGSGSRLTLDMIEFRRPGEGLGFSEIDPLIGRVLSRDVSAGEMVVANDFMN